jgi:hypothetical protein
VAQEQVCGDVDISIRPYARQYSFVAGRLCVRTQKACAHGGVGGKKSKKKKKKLTIIYPVWCDLTDEAQST